MILLLISFVFLLVTLSTCTVTVFVLPGFLYNLCTILAYVLEFLIHLVYFWCEILIFLGSSLLDAIAGVVHAYHVVAPHLSRAFRNIWTNGPFILDGLLNMFNLIRMEAWNFAVHQKEYFVAMWASILAFYAYFSRSFSPNGNDHLQDGEEENDNLDRQNYNNGELRNRNQRLYPVLPDINDEDIYLRNNDQQYDDEQHGEADLNDANMEEENVDASGNIGAQDDGDNSLCVICLDSDRCTAVFPCGHTHMCELCTRDVMLGRNRCPMCQRRIAEYRIVYL